MNLGRRERILVVEDETAVRDNVLRFLELEGYLATGAEDGPSGVAAALRSPPDLVLCDLNMPGMDGFGVLAQLRADPRTAGVPFVFLTASAEIEDAKTGYRLGADEYVTKPFSMPVLAAIIRQRLDARGKAS